MALSKLSAASFQDNVKFRNIIINGDMSIAQRGTSATGITSTSYNTIDRFNTEMGSLGTWTQSQSTDVPSAQGFVKSLKMDCTTANASPSATAFLGITQRIEGQNLQYLKKGTANAESLTASFWVKSNKTGTYILEIFDVDNTRAISKSYTISSADTWEKKIITFEGDTTGTLDNDNNRSLQFRWWLGGGSDYTSGTLQTSWGTRVSANRAVGQVNLADSTSNEWYITGVQLEAGETASEFEFLPVDVNLQRCLRYYELIVFDNGQRTSITNASVYSSSRTYGVIDYTKKRTTPSLDQTTGTAYYRILNNGQTDTFDSFTLQNNDTTRGRMYNTDTIAATAGHSGWFETDNDNAYLAIDAEL